MQRRPTPEERLQPTMLNRAVRMYRPTRGQTSIPYPAPRPQQYTLVRQPPVPPAPPPRQYAPQSHRLPARQETRRFNRWWVIVPLVGMFMMVMALCVAVTLGVGLIYNSGILPRVSAAGVSLGGLSQAEAEALLTSEWDTITLRDGERTWTFNPAELGITLDAAATAQAAYAQGRGEGNIMRALLSGAEVAPVIRVDLTQAASALNDLAPQFAVAPVNAGIELVNGEVLPTLPQDGRALNIEGMIDLLRGDVAAALADGTMELPMVRVVPQISDSTPMITQARALLANPLRIFAYDPIEDTTDEWRVAPQEWSEWLTATADPTSSTGLALALNEAAFSTYLARQNTALGNARYINTGEGLAAMQAALARGVTDTTLRVYHHDRQHTIQAGDTLLKIAWAYGVPYPWIQQANPGLGEALTIGQTITIPSADNFLDYPPVPNKRIVVSMSEQRTRVYENGQLKWDWLSSTGIQDSPTWPGVYQIILHDPNAYASRWNLQMPWFMGVYRPVPGDDFTNGFHGFPTRGGSQLLWTNNLGTRVTYGCILLSSENAKLLYDWAEEGVVVEIVA